MVLRYFQDVLASPNLLPDLNEIQLNKDGSWSCQLQDKKVPKTEKLSIDDSIEIIGDDIGKLYSTYKLELLFIVVIIC